MIPGHTGDKAVVRSNKKEIKKLNSLNFYDSDMIRTHRRVRYPESK